MHMSIPAAFLTPPPVTCHKGVIEMRRGDSHCFLHVLATKKTGGFYNFLKPQASQCFHTSLSRRLDDLGLDLG